MHAKNKDEALDEDEAEDESVIDLLKKIWIFQTSYISRSLIQRSNVQLKKHSWDILYVIIFEGYRSH